LEEDKVAVIAASNDPAVEGPMPESVLVRFVAGACALEFVIVVVDVD
jgi:hypothetical protein